MDAEDEGNDEYEGHQASAYLALHLSDELIEKVRARLDSIA